MTRSWCVIMCGCWVLQVVVRCGRGGAAGLEPARLHTLRQGGHTSNPPPTPCPDTDSGLTMLDDLEAYEAPVRESAVFLTYWHASLRCTPRVAFCVVCRWGRWFRTRWRRPACPAPSAHECRPTRRRTRSESSIDQTVGMRGGAHRERSRWSLSSASPLAIKCRRD